MSLAVLLLCAAMLVGCKEQAPVLAPTSVLELTGTPAPTRVPHTSTARPTDAVRPTDTARPTNADLAEAMDEPEHLVSQRASSPPTVDGQIEALWADAEPLVVPLTWGAGGTAHALDVELRAMHNAQTLYLLAQWPGEAPSGEQDTVYNQFTVHWRIPEPDAALLDCNVACHTAFADGGGRVAYANAETIPHGGSETLQAAGGWEARGGDAGTWTLEWSRPLSNGNPFDLQLTDRERAYAFMVKVFARVEGRPDPVSKPHRLVFAP